MFSVEFGIELLVLDVFFEEFLGRSRGLDIKKEWVLFSFGPFPKRSLKVQNIYSEN